MSSVGHSEACFNHSCLKVPVDSSSRRPFPKYERLSSAENSKKNKVPDGEKAADFYDNFKRVKSYLEFYESIPDYTELHHLPNEEFYSRLKLLKLTQKRFRSESGAVNGSSAVEKELSKECDRDHKLCSVCCLDKDYCNALNGDVKPRGTLAPPKINICSDNDNDASDDLYESEFKKHSDYEADRESSTLLAGDKPRKSSGKYLSVTNIGDEYVSGSCSKRSRSLPVSSGCDCDTPDWCHRYSGVNFRNDRYDRDYGSKYGNSLKDKDSGTKISKQTHARPVPRTSRILLYDKIMQEKEARRRIIHERYSEKLRSLVQPFSFTKREENKRLRLARSNPELFSADMPSVRFKAKPVPKHLFSNYAWERMKEDDFYRALKRRIRAEEMLKSSSLPPSMALREKQFLSKSLDFIDYRCPEKTWVKNRGYRRECEAIRRSIEFDERNRASDSGNKKKSVWLPAGNKSRRITSTTDSSEISPYESALSETRRKPRTASSYSSRNNLASVLRIETARRRLEKEMEDSLRESRLRDAARFKARLVRMTPAWQALNYDREEDLALRVAARREEERMKQESHQRSMESMYGRVYNMPPLFHDERFQSGRNSRPKSSCQSKSVDLIKCKYKTDDTLDHPKDPVNEDLLDLREPSPIKETSSTSGPSFEKNEKKENGGSELSDGDRENSGNLQ